MNALLLTAIFGVIMMFSSFLLQSKTAIRGLAITGLTIVVIANVLEMSGMVFFKIDTKGMLGFDRFALLLIRSFLSVHSFTSSCRRGIWRRLG